MKSIPKILWVVAALALSCLNLIILKNGFPDGEGDPVQFSNGIKFIWIQVGLFSAITSFAWLALFLSKKKALLLSAGVWLAVSTAYTTHDLAMRSKLIIATDYLHADDFWQPVHADSLMDGGSILLGLVNGQGEVVYLKAWPDDVNSEQRISLELNFNDGNDIFIAKGSQLEKQLVVILNNLHIRTYQEVFTPLIEEFKQVLSDRSVHVTGKIND